MDAFYNALNAYTEEIHSLQEDPALWSFITGECDPISYNNQLLFHIFLIEVMKNGPHAFLVEEAVKRGMIDKTEPARLAFVARLLKDDIEVPTLTNLFRWEMMTGRMMNPYL